MNTKEKKKLIDTEINALFLEYCWSSYRYKDYWIRKIDALLDERLAL